MIYERSFVHKERGGMPNSKGDQARVEILEVAKRLFLSQGYGSTSMRDIAKAAGGRAVAGIYNHFPTKEDLFRALIDNFNPYEELITALEQTEGETAQAFITSVLRVVLPLLLKHFDYLELVQIDLREFQGRNMQRLAQSLIIPRVLVIVQRLLTLPGIKPVEPVVIMRMMAGMVLSYTLTEKVAPRFLIEQLSAEIWIERYIDFAVSGLTTDPRTP
jgi:AcrR family transcriptional regulator